MAFFLRKSPNFEIRFGRNNLQTERILFVHILGLYLIKDKNSISFFFLTELTVAYGEFDKTVSYYEVEGAEHASPSF
jgi:hypothetical protein